MLRDRQVTVYTDQELTCHVTEQTSHKQAIYETVTRAVTRAAATSTAPFRFVRNLFYIVPFLAIIRTPATHRRPFLHHTYTPLVYINPFRGRTLQFKVATVSHIRVAFVRTLILTSGFTRYLYNRCTESCI